jgi:hypothetical protein
LARKRRISRAQPVTVSATVGVAVDVKERVAANVKEGVGNRSTFV